MVSGNAVSSESASAATDELLLLAAAVRFLEFSSPAFPAGALADGSGHPVLHIMQQAHPVLSALLESPQWRSHANVVEASCEVYQKTLLCVKVRSLATRRLPFIPPSEEGTFLTSPPVMSARVNGSLFVGPHVCSGKRVYSTSGVNKPGGFHLSHGNHCRGNLVVMLMRCLGGAETGWANAGSYGTDAALRLRGA